MPVRLPKAPGNLTYNYFHTVNKIPIMGTWLSRMGHVADIIATPNTPSPSIWALAAWNSLPRLAYTFAKPFLIADQFHQRTRTNHRSQKGIINLVGELTPAVEPVGGFAWVVFETGAALALELQWYFFLIDRTTEFFLNWASLAYEYSGMYHEGEYWQECSGSGTDIRAGGAGPVGPGYYRDSEGGSGPSDYVTSNSGHSGAAFGHGNFSFTPLFEDRKNWNVSFQNVTQSLTVWSIDQNSPVDLNGNTGGAGWTTYTMTGATGEAQDSWAMVYSGDPGFLQYNYTMQIYDHRTGTKGLLFDP